MKVVIRKSSRPEKKWMAQFENGRTVHFGATGYQDYTQHKDPERMRRYRLRHPPGRENHGKSGMYTAGFWAMNLLWNKPSLKASASDISRRFGLQVSFSGKAVSASKGSAGKRKPLQRTRRRMRMRALTLSRIISFLPKEDRASMAQVSREYAAVDKITSYFDLYEYQQGDEADPKKNFFIVRSETPARLEELKGMLGERLKLAILILPEIRTGNQLQEFNQRREELERAPYKLQVRCKVDGQINLPSNTVSVEFGANFNQPFETSPLPEGLLELRIGQFYRQDLKGSLSKTLKKLIFDSGYSFVEPLGRMLADETPYLETLDLGGYGRTSVINPVTMRPMISTVNWWGDIEFPTKWLRHLRISELSNESIKKLPESLVTLVVQKSIINLNGAPKKLPSNLRRLAINKYDYDIADRGIFPDKLMSLVLGSTTDQQIIQRTTNRNHYQLSIDALPDSIEKLTLLVEQRVINEHLIPINDPRSNYMATIGGYRRKHHGFEVDEEVREWTKDGKRVLGYGFDNTAQQGFTGRFAIDFPRLV